jgi:hypothetical protein
VVVKRTPRVRIAGHGDRLRLRTLGDWEADPIHALSECRRAATAVQKAIWQTVAEAREARAQLDRDRGFARRDEADGLAALLRRDAPPDHRRGNPKEDGHAIQLKAPLCNSSSNMAVKFIVGTGLVGTGVEHPRCSQRGNEFQAPQAPRWPRCSSGSTRVRRAPELRPPGRRCAPTQTGHASAQRRVRSAAGLARRSRAAAKDHRRG